MMSKLLPEQLLQLPRNDSFCYLSQKGHADFIYSRYPFVTILNASHHATGWERPWAESHKTCSATLC